MQPLQYVNVGPSFVIHHMCLLSTCVTSVIRTRRASLLRLWLYHFSLGSHPCDRAISQVSRLLPGHVVYMHEAALTCYV